MLFNTIEFAIFMPLFFVIYWLLSKKINAQNILILVFSYVFYGWWDYRFLLLILFSTIVDYFIGIKIFESPKFNSKKYYLILSIIINLGFLGFFKYFNFFIESFTSSFKFFGYNIGISNMLVRLFP